MSNIPSVTVVIPALNEADRIGACLQALTRQDYKGKLEIIVVDNGSADRTVDIASSYGVKVLSEKTPGVVMARVKGFSKVRGDVILSTDADTIVPEDWVSTYAARFEDPKTDAVIGQFTYYDAKAIKERIGAALTPLGFKADEIFGGHFSGCNFGIRKSVYEDCGGFDTGLHYGEDFGLTGRVRNSGYRTTIAREIVVATSARQFSRHFRKVMFNLMWLSAFDRPAVKMSGGRDIR